MIIKNMLKGLSRLIGRRTDIEYQLIVNAKSKLLKVNNSKVVLVGSSPIRSEIYQGLVNIYGDRLIIPHDNDGTTLFDKYGNKYYLKEYDPCIIVSYIHRFHIRSTSWLKYEMEGPWFKELNYRKNPVIYIFSVSDKEFPEIEHRSPPSMISDRKDSAVKLVKYYSKSGRAYATDMINVFDTIRTLTDDL